MRFSLIVAHLVDVSIPTTTNTRELLAERPGRISQASNRKFQTSSARHQAAGFKISESRFFAPRLGGRHARVTGEIAFQCPSPGQPVSPAGAGNSDWGENDESKTGYHWLSFGRSQIGLARTAETAAGLTVESSAENPKNDERTKGEPGGKKFRTCSEI